jgi:GTPase SAR1 family protein
LREWIELCHLNKKERAIMVLVGNKVDLGEERKVEKDKAETLAQNEDIAYFEVSAKNNCNIREIFMYAAEKDAMDTVGS